MNEVTFEIVGEPKGKGRPKFARVENGVRTYTPKETENYEAYVKMSYLSGVGRVKLNGAVQADITAIFPIPKSTSKRERERMAKGHVPYTKKIDADNLAKTVLDAINGIAYDDDKQVARLTVIKEYGEEPCVKVRLKEI